MKSINFSNSVDSLMYVMCHRQQQTKTYEINEMEYHTCTIPAAQYDSSLCSNCRVTWTT